MSTCRPDPRSARLDEVTAREDYLYRINHCPHYWPAIRRPSSLCGGCGQEFNEINVMEGTGSQ